MSFFFCMNFVYTKSEQVQIQLKSIFLVAPKLNSRYYRKLGKSVYNLSYVAAFTYVLLLFAASSFFPQVYFSH